MKKKTINFVKKIYEFRNAKVNNFLTKRPSELPWHSLKGEFWSDFL